MVLDSPTMEQIVSSVFQDMLQMQTTPAAPLDTGADDVNMVASIRITGTTKAMIFVEAPLGTAKGIGENMFAAEPNSLQEEEIRDAIGEIANMIGGNVKGMYEGESQLSLPCISNEEHHEFGAGSYDSVSFQVCGLPLQVHWKTPTE